MKISKFANNVANVMNSEHFVFRYLQHILDTSQFVQVFQHTLRFDLFPGNIWFLSKMEVFCLFFCPEGEKVFKNQFVGVLLGQVNASPRQILVLLLAAI